jgi:hypothetical protein
MSAATTPRLSARSQTSAKASTPSCQRWASSRVGMFQGSVQDTSAEMHVHQATASVLLERMRAA